MVFLSVEMENVKAAFQRIVDEDTCIKILIAHAYCTDTAVFVGGTVIDTLVCIHAAGISGDFISAVFHADHAAGVFCGAQNVEKLIYRFGF